MIERGDLGGELVGREKSREMEVVLRRTRVWNKIEWLLLAFKDLSKRLTNHMIG